MEIWLSPGRGKGTPWTFLSTHPPRRYSMWSDKHIRTVLEVQAILADIYYDRFNYLSLDVYLCQEVRDTLCGSAGL